MALTLINSFEISPLIGLVLDGNYKELTRAKGVGPKLAQKIILELKDKLTNYGDTQKVQISKSTSNVATSQNVEDAVQVLTSLGYVREEIGEAMNKVLARLAPDAPAEEILKDALTLLSL